MFIQVIGLFPHKLKRFKPYIEPHYRTLTICNVFFGPHKIAEGGIRNTATGDFVTPHQQPGAFLVPEYSGSYMSDHVLFNPLKGLRKTDKMRGLPSIFSFFSQILDYFCHMTLRLL